ncbi:5-hydroxytryptamine receptor 4 [Trichoplax sp. H2]|nr:5-hydroxytryptamine receptor 4 [Trichoplax sp. H2]|eukprot:RDD40502.1 5-hydroxytryptamine receptor 4 [Trichoplax sp. H2]
MASINNHTNNVSGYDFNNTTTPSFEILPYFFDFVWLALVIFILIPNLYLFLLIIGKRRLRTRSNALIASLALVDMSYALFFILPMSVLLIMHHHGGQHWTRLNSILCQSAYSIIRPILDFNINLHICFISLEQFIAIGYPFKYRSYINNNLTFVFTIIIIYTTSIILGAMPFIATWYDFDFPGCTIQLNAFSILIAGAYFQAWNITCLVVLFPLPFLTITMFYTKIYSIANQHFRRTMPNAFNMRPSVNYRVAVNKKAAKAIAVLLADIIILRLPYVTVLIIIYSGLATAGNVTIFVTALMITQIMGAFTSVVNPFLYSYYNKDLRRSFYKRRYCIFYQAVQVMASASSTTRISRILQRR